MSITFDSKKIFQIVVKYTQYGYRLALKAYIPTEDMIKKKT